MYVHVPAAWLGMGGWTGLAIASLVQIVWRHPLAGIAGRAIAAPGALFTAIRSEEHTSELQSLMRNSYAVFCLKKKNFPNNTRHRTPDDQQSQQFHINRTIHVTTSTTGTSNIHIETL